MSNRAPWAVRTLSAVVASVLLLVAASASGHPLPQKAAAVQAVEDAAMLIQENRLQEALETLTRAIEEDDEYWEAYYQSGRVLGLLSRWQEAHDALLRATELNAGHAHSHRLAALAAINIEEWDSAWDQAIKAQLAGEDMRQTLLDMYEMSPPPEDFAVRINAATVFVADVDTSTAIADTELPTNFNPQASGAAGTRLGRGSNLEDSAVNQSTLDLIRLQRAMRNALAASPRMAVVVNPGQANFILAIQLTEISRGQASGVSSVRGYFRFIDIEKQEIVYRQPIEFDDLSSTPEIAGKLRRYTTDLAVWLATLEGGGN